MAGDPLNAMSGKVEANSQAFGSRFGVKFRLP